MGRDRKDQKLNKVYILFAKYDKTELKKIHRYD